MKTHVWLPKIVIGILLCGSIGGIVTAGVGVLRRGGVSPASSPPASLPSGDTTPRYEVTGPRIEVDALEHNLGVVDSSRECAHVFVIRNVGDAPLHLKRGSTTCECTMSEVPSEPIPPGGQAGVRVSSDVAGGKSASRPGDPVDGFSHGATIFTNDPDRPSISLWIRGVVRTTLATNPPRFEFPQLEREETRQASMVVFSQSWDGFSIDAAKASQEGFTWKIEPASEANLTQLRARCGYQVALTTPTTLPGGALHEWLDLSITPENGSEPARNLRLPIVGNVAPSVSVYGQKLLGGKVLWLGSIRPGERVEGQLIMKVRDGHRVVAFKHIRSTPAYLEVNVHPSAAGGENLGLYTIDVAVPADAPAGSFMGARRGAIRIETDHPELPVLQFDVEYAVTGA